MDWISSISDFWVDWQLRALGFSLLVLWISFGSGSRSPVWRFSILAVGCWLMFFMPLMIGLLPKFELAVLPFNETTSTEKTAIHQVFFLVSILVTALLLLPSILAAKSLKKAHSNLRNANDLEQIFQQCIDVVKPKKTVSCHYSKLALAPFTYGFKRHYIVLPTQAKNWPLNKVKICLMHELWHVKREDWLTQQITVLVAFLNLLNPLAWLLRNELCRRMEESVDKLCVYHGINPREYASVLVSQAKFSKAESRLFAPTFFGDNRYGKSTLQQRVGSLVEEPFGWQGISRLRLTALFIAMLLLAVATSTIRLTPLPENFERQIRWVVYNEFSGQENDADAENWKSLQVPPLKPRAIQLPATVEMVEQYSGSRILNKDVELIDAENAFLKQDLINLDLEQIINQEALKILTPPTALHLERPAFPLKEARRNREGWVELGFDINELGEPLNIRVNGSSGSFYFEHAAKKALKKSVFESSAGIQKTIITRDLSQLYLFVFTDSQAQP